MKVIAKVSSEVQSEVIISISVKTTSVGVDIIAESNSGDKQVLGEIDHKGVLRLFVLSKACAERMGLLRNPGTGCIQCLPTQ